MGTVLGLILYLLTPFVIYLSEIDRVAWINGKLLQPYNLSFLFIALFVILTLKFTRRRKGFKVTPMDFLILFIAFVIPNIPDERIIGYHMGFIAAKIILLFFSYEVLMGELRGKWKTQGLAAIPALVVLGVRGLVG